MLNQRCVAVHSVLLYDKKMPIDFLLQELCQGLLQCLGHPKKAVQRRAAEHLIRFARVHPEVISLLTVKLSDPDPRLRWTAAFALAQIDLPAPGPLPVLLENLGHEESDLRWAAAVALGQRGKFSPEVRAALEEAARGVDTSLRKAAEAALKRLTPSQD